MARSLPCFTFLWSSKLRWCCGALAAVKHRLDLCLPLGVSPSLHPSLNGSLGWWVGQTGEAICEKSIKIIFLVVSAFACVNGWGAFPGFCHCQFRNGHEACLLQAIVSNTGKCWVEQGGGQLLCAHGHYTCKHNIKNRAGWILPSISLATHWN